VGSNPACPTKPYISRARVEALSAALLAGRSATATLERLVGAGRLMATPVKGAARAPDAATRALLGTDAVRYRHVRLGCDGIVLSVAENWYVPARLTAAMNARLASGSEPFGRVVAALRCERRAIEARVLPEGCEHVLEHRAALFDAQGAAVAVVHERYTRAAADMEIDG
jgi:chorismate-pyruvate lyase